MSLDLKRAIPIDVRFAVQQGGRFEAKGTVVPGQPSGRMDFRLAGLALKPFDPYLNQFARLRLDGGAVGTQGKLTFDPGRKLTAVPPAPASAPNSPASSTTRPSWFVHCRAATAGATRSAVGRQIDLSANFA